MSQEFFFPISNSDVERFEREKMRSGENCKILAIWSIHRHRSFLSAVCMGVIHSRVFFSVSHPRYRDKLHVGKLAVLRSGWHLPMHIVQAWSSAWPIAFSTRWKKSAVARWEVGGLGWLSGCQKRMSPLGFGIPQKMWGGTWYFFWGGVGIEIPNCWVLDALGSKMAGFPCFFTSLWSLVFGVARGSNRWSQPIPALKITGTRQLSPEKRRFPLKTWRICSLSACPHVFCQNATSDSWKGAIWS